MQVEQTTDRNERMRRYMCSIISFSGLVVFIIDYMYNSSTTGRFIYFPVSTSRLEAREQQHFRPPKTKKKV